MNKSLIPELYKHNKFFVEVESTISSLPHDLLYVPKFTYIDEAGLLGTQTFRRFKVILADLTEEDLTYLKLIGIGLQLERRPAAIKMLQEAYSMHKQSTGYKENE